MEEKQKEGTWNISKEQSALVENLKTMKPGDPGYKETLDAVEQCGKIKESKWTTVANVAKNIALGGVLIVACFLSYAVDASDEIPKNRNIKELFTRTFRP